MEGADSYAIIPNSEIIMAFDKLDIDDGITLTRARSDDAEEIFALVDGCRDYLREWMSRVDSTKGVTDIHTFVDRAEKQYADDNGFQCCIRMQGSIVGVIGFVYVNRVHKRTEIGYWVGAEYQGRRIATKATRALTDYAFSAWNLNRVELWIATGNARSRAVAERLRFKQEGIFRERHWVNDRFHNDAIYGMLRREWTTT